MRLIGLHGRKGSGKDTAYRYIADECERQKLTSLRVAFADPLKISAARALGFEGTKAECLQFCDKLKEQSNINTVWYEPGAFTGYSVPKAIQISGREFLQRYGTEAHRQVFGDSFWIDVALPCVPNNPVRARRHEEAQAALQERYPGVDLLVVTDVRFANEAARILELGGEVWKVDRPELDDQDAHASERPLEAELIDKVIVNDCDHATYANRIAEAL